MITYIFCSLHVKHFKGNFLVKADFFYLLNLGLYSYRSFKLHTKDILITPIRLFSITQTMNLIYRLEETSFLNLFHSISEQFIEDFPCNSLITKYSMKISSYDSAQLSRKLLRSIDFSLGNVYTAILFLISPKECFIFN